MCYVATPPARSVASPASSAKRCVVRHAGRVSSCKERGQRQLPASTPAYRLAVCALMRRLVAFVRTKLMQPLLRPLSEFTAGSSLYSPAALLGVFYIGRVKLTVVLIA